MGLWDFLLLLLVAAIIGGIGEAIAGYSPGGLLMSCVSGFVGAVVGRWLQHQTGLPEFLMVKVSGHTFPVVWSVIGAALFIMVIKMISGRNRTTYVSS